MLILIFVIYLIKMLLEIDIFNYHYKSHEIHHKFIQNLIILYLIYQAF